MTKRRNGHHLTPGTLPTAEQEAESKERGAELTRREAQAMSGKVKIDHKFRKAKAQDGRTIMEDAQLILTECRAAVAALPADVDEYDIGRHVRADVTYAKRQLQELGPVTAMLVAGLVDKFKASIVAASAAAATMYDDVPGFGVERIVTEWEAASADVLALGLTHPDGTPYTGRNVTRTIAPESDDSIIRGMVSRALRLAS